MGESNLTGKVHTVLGPIDPEVLGVTLTHEHFLIDQSVWFTEPTANSEKVLAHQPVTLQNLGWVRYHPYNSLDNISLMDEQMAINEALRFKLAGGNSVVDLTNIGLGRDALAIARISRSTGLNIIMGSGYYIKASLPSGIEFKEEKIAETIIRDIEVGVDNSGIRAGIIGEIGCTWPSSDSDVVLLRGAALAQKQTGAPINVHPGMSPDSPFMIIEVLADAGADIGRVAISHIERTIFEHKTLVRLAKTGCYLEYDMFAFEGWHNTVRMVLSETNLIKRDLPNDAGRINQIIALINEGFVKQILVSHDHCHKHNLWHYGGPGYSHILDNIVPLMRKKGINQEHIHTILVENPKRLLQFA